MKIISALMNLGLTDKEARIYTALLQLGKASAYSVALKSGLKKPTTYVILDELVEKGLATKIPVGKKQLYSAHSAQEIFAAAEARLQAAREALPAIEALSKGASSKVNILYFEGFSGVKQALEYKMLKGRGGETLVGFYAHVEGASGELLDYLKEYNGRLKQKNISVRRITPDHPTSKSYHAREAEHGHPAKTVSSGTYSSKVSLEATDDIVRIVDLKNKQAVVIENSEVARAVQDIFALVWELLPHEERMR